MRQNRLPRNPRLQQKLLRMAHTDQVMRHGPIWDPGVDRRNTREMKNIIAQNGWPTISMVGKKGTQAAWLIVQHADRDVRFQRRCLRLLKDHKNDGEVYRRHIAYLWDRVNINEGRPQLFGTQFYTNRQGRFGPRPIRTRKLLSRRRHAYHMQPFARYELSMKEYMRSLQGKTESRQRRSK